MSAPTFPYQAPFMLATRPFPILAVLLLGLPSTDGLAEEQLRFNRDIRPILSENCYHCHGPDDAARAADLRLDAEEAAKEWAIVAGDAEASELISRVFSDDADLVMPPPDSERSLTEGQKETLRKWVQQGAGYEPHWSFLPPRKEEPPLALDDANFNLIDCFVLDRIRQAKLSRARPADRETLLRRMTFDLIGLPPTLDEIESYVGDDSPIATERVIDRLLADPRFGERMAADWLDVARYSDTYGYQVDRDRFVWPWRDWVVDAFNRNLPYDQFLTEQLAGDLLPDATRDQILATTFSRLHPQKVEGGSVPEEFRIEYVADRTQTVGTAFLGLTMECCRCHSHKYDPITQTEYYELSAFFANIDEAGLYSYFTPSIPTPTLTLPTDAEAAALVRAEDRIATAYADYRQSLALETPLVSFDRAAFRKEVEKEVASESETEGKESVAKTTEVQLVDTLFAQPIEAVDFEGSSGANESVDGVVGKAVKLTGDDPVNLEKGNYRRDQPFSVSLWMNTPDAKERAVVFHRSRAWTDAASRGYQLLLEDGCLSWSLIHFWPGNAIRIRATEPLPAGEWVQVTVTNDGSSTAAGLAIYVNGQKAETEIVRDNLTKNMTGGGGDNIAIGQRFRDKGFTGGVVDQFRVFEVELTELEIFRLAEPNESLAWVDEPLDKWSKEQRDLMTRHLHARHNAEVQQARKALGTARRALFATQDKLQEIMVMREQPKRRVSYRLNRGAYDDRAEAVRPATPRAVREFGEEYRDDRLGLAEWMTEPDHPLTSRVAVNRLWQLFFGVGLVRTPEDFGSQGQPPTHPELLDWLAIDFVEHDWDVKRAIKQIVMSRTYQQSSEHSDSRVWEIDPENRLLTRHNAYRLPAEMLRDQSLAVAGQLVSQVGGPPVKPYEVEASFKPTKRDQGVGLYRRSLYTYWKRTGPAPAMMTLDASKRDVCRVQRERTSSPLQAFVLLNGPQYVEAARSLAISLAEAHGGETQLVLRNAFRTLTSREPRTEELSIVSELFETQHAYFQANPDRAKRYLAVGEFKAPTHLDADRLAALSAVIGTLMNFDESVMKR